uniref:Uncharacterized protein n=1 Tax=Bursaphelenchus xylophilus TaxID=6326 RepID=A0A1I7SPK4_BURXY
MNNIPVPNLRTSYRSLQNNIKKVLVINEVSNRILSMKINFDWTIYTGGISSDSSKQILITSVAQKQVEDGSVQTILAVPALHLRRPRLK